MSAIKGLAHIALRVRDLDKSLAFYESLGIKEFLRLLEDDGEPWIVYLRFSDQLYLELFLGSPNDEKPDRDSIGVNHLSLAVDDLDAAAAEFEAAGIALQTPLSDRRGVDKNRGLWIADPDGNRIEVMEMAPDCIQYDAIRNFAEGNPPQALNLPRRR